MIDYFDEVLNKLLDGDLLMKDKYSPEEYNYYITGCTAMKNHDLLDHDIDRLERDFKIDEDRQAISYKEQTEIYIDKFTCYLQTAPGMLALANVYVCPKNYSDDISLLSQFTEEELQRELRNRRVKEIMNALKKEIKSEGKA